MYAGFEKAIATLEVKLQDAPDDNIRSIPAPLLIDREGRLISHNTRGADLERLVAEAVRDKSTD